VHADCVILALTGTVVTNEQFVTVSSLLPGLKELGTKAQNLTMYIHNTFRLASNVLPMKL